MAGYSGKPLVQKIGVKAGHRLALAGEPDGFIKFPPSVAAYGRELDATCGRPRPTIE